jgi:hypothetical protein
MSIRVTADAPLNRLLRAILPRALWLLFAAYLFTELFFLGNDDPVANKAYLVVMGAVIVIGGNMIYPHSLLAGLRPVMRFALWSLIVALIAFFSLLFHNKAPHATITSALMALAVFNLSFLMCCAGHFFLTTGNKAHPTQLIFTIVIVLTMLPVWLGPWINSLLSDQTTIDLIISASPLTQLAVMADFDYLRSQWFYTHSPYGSIQYDYPTKLELTLYYLSLALMLAWGAHLINQKISREKK